MKKTHKTSCLRWCAVALLLFCANCDDDRIEVLANNYCAQLSQCRSDIYQQNFNSQNECRSASEEQWHALESENTNACFDAMFKLWSCVTELTCVEYDEWAMVEDATAIPEAYPCKDEESEEAYHCL